MLGYDISWAAFNIIEVMSSTKFTFKVSSYKYLNDNIIMNNKKLNSLYI